MTDIGIMESDPWAEPIYINLPNGARLAMVRCESCKRPRFMDYACDGCRAESAAAEMTRLREELKKWREVESGPWPLTDVLEKLSAFAMMLLRDKNYDGEGWESVQVAAQTGRRQYEILRRRAEGGG